MYAVELVKKIVVEVDAKTWDQAIALALAADASSENQSSWDHAEAAFGPQPGASADFCRDVRCTAYEGGSTYWAEGQNVKRSPEGEYLSFELRSSEDRDDPKLGRWTLIDDNAIRAACERILNESLVGSGALTQISAAFNRDPQGDAGQIDAEAADCIMQIACFGEIVFG